MRKLSFSAIVVLMMFSGTSTLSAADLKNPGITPIESSIPAESPEARTQVLVDRLHEIKAMDIKLLSVAEKKELRKEVRAIKSELKAAGVYISITAILIILLIILLI